MKSKIKSRGYSPIPLFFSRRMFMEKFHASAEYRCWNGIAGGFGLLNS